LDQFPLPTLLSGKIVPCDPPSGFFTKIPGSSRHFTPEKVPDFRENPVENRKGSGGVASVHFLFSRYPEPHEHCIRANVCPEITDETAGMWDELCWHRGRSVNRNCTHVTPQLCRMQNRWPGQGMLLCLFYLQDFFPQSKKKRKMKNEE
jgi:hypothetical protein